MVSYIQPSEIPSLSFLYHLKKLHAAPDNAKLPVTLTGPNTTPPASKERNDRVSIMRSNITVLAVDAIVNAANSSLLGGGGVDGAIHAAAGPGLLAECRLAGGCQTGFVKITNAYMLPCQKVIHAVGPVYYEAIGDLCENQLSNCYTRALRVAEDAGCRSVAFSAISTGVYGYPSKLAAPVAIAAVRSYLDKYSKGVLEKVVFVTFMEKDFNAYMEFLPYYFPPVGVTVADAHQTGDVSAENEARIEAEAKAVAEELPNAPTTAPSDGDHAQKKHKTSDS